MLLAYVHSQRVDFSLLDELCRLDRLGHWGAFIKLQLFSACARKREHLGLDRLIRSMRQLSNFCDSRLTKRLGFPIVAIHHKSKTKTHGLQHPLEIRTLVE